MKRYTMSEIRSANMAAGFHNFDRKTLRFFGETMRNWKAGAVNPDGTQVVVRSGGRAGFGRFTFNPKDGSVKKEVA